MSTFSPTSSSIRDWLEYGYGIPSSYDWDDDDSRDEYLNHDIRNLPILPTCQENDVGISCAQVCNNSALLFSAQSTNLVTCGIWTSLVMAYGYRYNEFNGTLASTNVTVADMLSSAFNNFSLSAGDLYSVSSYADTISNCFQLIYTNVKHFSYADDGRVPAACTRQGLFPVGDQHQSVKQCV